MGNDAVYAYTASNGYNLLTDAIFRSLDRAFCFYQLRMFLNRDTDVTVKSVTVITVNGQHIETQLSANNQINLESLHKGFYILEVIAEEGNSSHKNFVKGS